MGMLLPAFRILIVLSMPSGPWLVLSRFSLKKADLFHDVFLPFAEAKMPMVTPVFWESVL